MRSDDADLILQHAFETPERLRLALLVGATYPKICQRLVQRRVDEIRNYLESKFGIGWDFKHDRTGSSFYFSFRKCSWPEPMISGFGRDAPGENLYLFAHRWGAPNRRLPIDDRLKLALDSGIGASQKPTEWSCWWRYLDRYRNWNQIDTLEELATSDEPVEYIGALLERMRKISEPILDAEAEQLK